MDNVVTSLLIIDGDGRVSEQAGGYSDWESRGGGIFANTERSPADASTRPEKQPHKAAKAPVKPGSRKLSYRETRELETLPALIETLEQRQAELENTVADPEFYRGDHGEIDRVMAELADVQAELDVAFERWAELEGENA